MISKFANSILAMPRLFGLLAILLCFCLITELLNIKRVKLLWIINIAIGLLYLIIPKIMVYPIMVVIFAYGVIGTFFIAPKFVLYLAAIVIVLGIIT